MGSEGTFLYTGRFLRRPLRRSRYLRCQRRYSPLVFFRFG